MYEIIDSFIVYHQHSGNKENKLHGEGTSPYNYVREFGGRTLVGVSHVGGRVEVELLSSFKPETKKGSLRFGGKSVSQQTPQKYPKLNGRSADK